MRLICTKPDGGVFVEVIAGLAVSTDRVLIFALPDGSTVRREPSQWKSFQVVMQGLDR